MGDKKPLQTITGRGAVSNPAGRFETRVSEAADDGWDLPEDAAPAPETTVTAEPAKSILNRNDSPDLPFDRSINPYRGCEHGCVYCLDGSTPILMADGRHRPLAEIKAGDEIYGTQRSGWYRRYVKTHVLARWSVIKPAYRVLLEDGTEVVAGGDHRFLTERGWKFVTDRHASGVQRARLTTNNKLMGVGAFTALPAENADYARGYLCGIIRGDGLLKIFRYQRPGRSHGDQHQFRLALCDVEALERAQRYLHKFGIVTGRFVFKEANANRRALHGIRNFSQSGVARVRELVEWPAEASESWSAGFLAGIFDAEGSYSQGVWRISNTDAFINDWIARCLRRFGFDYAVEELQRSGLRPITVWRLTGGLREHLRFFHATRPAITRKLTFEGQALKSSAKLRVIAIEPLRKALRLYDITTGTGDFIANGVVSHNCYARPSHAYLNLSPGLDFETRLFYKPNAAELLERELRRPGYRVQPLALGSNTDCYQPIERRLKITRGILEVLARFRHPVGIVTKSTLIERDLDLLIDLARDDLVGVGITLTTLDPELKRRLEPRAPSPAARLRTMEKLAAAGIPVRVMFSPVIPFINDAELERVLEAASRAGASAASYVLLRLPWELKALFREWLDAHYPLKAAHVMSLVQQAHGGRDYSAQWGTRFTGQGQFAALIAQRFALARRRCGLERERAAFNSAVFRVPPEAASQLALF